MHTPGFEPLVHPIHAGHAVSRRAGLRGHLQDSAVQTVLLQAETLCRDWVA
jgi:hypothetical protein